MLFYIDCAKLLFYYNIKEKQQKTYWISCAKKAVLRRKYNFSI